MKKKNSATNNDDKYKQKTLVFKKKLEKKNVSFVRVYKKKKKSLI